MVIAIVQRKKGNCGDITTLVGLLPTHQPKFPEYTLIMIVLRFARLKI
jgi:hypothetical protein